MTKGIKDFKKSLKRQNEMYDRLYRSTSLLNDDDPKLRGLADCMQKISKTIMELHFAIKNPKLLDVDERGDLDFDLTAMTKQVEEEEKKELLEKAKAKAQETKVNNDEPKASAKSE